MPDQETNELIKIGEMTLQVDDERDENDPFKLPAAFRTLLATRLEAARTGRSGVALGESARVLSHGDLRSAFDALEALLHDGYKHIAGLKSYDITPAERLAVFTAYGWEQGELGDFTDQRMKDLAGLAAKNTPGIAKAAHRYPAELLTRIAAELERVESLEPAATTGGRQVAVEARNDVRDDLHKAVSRTRHFYCYASDDTDETPQLAKIGLQPRREWGEVNHSLSVHSAAQADSSPNGNTPS